MWLTRTSRRAVFACAAIVVLCFAGGCSDDDDDDNPVNPGPTSTQFTGTYVSNLETGLMTVTINSVALAPALRAGGLATHTVTASAVLTPKLSVGSVSLTGTYDDESNALNLSNGDYTLVGQYDAAGHTLNGTYTGTLGPGVFLCNEGASNQVDVFCGVFESTMNPGSTGRWNIMFSGSNLQGVGVAAGGTFLFTGTVTGTGNTRTIAVSDEIAENVNLTAAGQVDLSTREASGTYAIENNAVPEDEGTWTGGGCTYDEPDPEPATLLMGTFISSGESGAMNVLISSEALARVRPAASMATELVNAGGTLVRHPGGPGSIELLYGVYNTETDSLALGNNEDYLMYGVYDDSGPIAGIVGQYTGPSGAGFFGCAVGEPGAVQVLCGEFQNTGATESGRWNLIIVGTNVVGMAISTDEDSFPLEGTVSGTGTTRTVTLSSDNGSGGTLTATGTLDTTTNTISAGTWETELNSTPVDSGTWDGEPCAVQGSTN